MSSKILWTGLTLILAGSLYSGLPLELVGQILMIIGVILLWLDR